MSAFDPIASVALQRQVTASFRKLRLTSPGLEGVAVIPVRCAPGAQLGVVFTVRRKVPIRYLPPSAVLPETLKLRIGGSLVSLPASVVETGPFRFRSDCQPQVYDPCMGGDALEVPTLKPPGTIAAFLTDLNGGIHLLSASHVLAGFSGMDVDTVISLYPAGPDIAFLEDYTPFLPQMTADAAIARVVNPPPGTASAIRNIGPLGLPIISPHFPMDVQKYGAASCRTQGIMCGIGTFQVDGYEFADTLFVRPDILAEGDSGSLLISDLRRPLGILFASATVAGAGVCLASRVSRIIDELHLQGWSWQ